MKPLSITIDPEDESEALAAPTRQQLALQAAKWFKDLKEFRAWEDAHLFGHLPATPLEVRRHRYQLSALMADGEMLLLGIALNDNVASLSDGVTRESIEANQRCLQLTFLDWHGDMAKERRQSMLDQVFPDAQPEA